MYGHVRLMDKRLMAEPTESEGRPGRPVARITALHQHGRRVEGSVRARCTRCNWMDTVAISFFEQSRRRPRCACGGVIAAVATVGMN